MSVLELGDGTTDGRRAQKEVPKVQRQRARDQPPDDSRRGRVRYTTLGRCDDGLGRTVDKQPPQQRRDEAGGNAHTAREQAHDALRRRHGGCAAVAEETHGTNGKAQPQRYQCQTVLSYAMAYAIT